MKISYKNLPDQVLAQLIYTYGKRPIGTANIVRTRTTEAPKEDVQQNSIAGKDSLEESNKGNTESKADNDETKVKEQENSEEKKENPNTDNKQKKPGFFENIKNFDINDAVSGITNWFANIKVELSPQILIIAGGIILGIVLIIVFRVLYDKSYLIRQKMANYRNRKRARRQYTIIRDTRRTKRGKWRKR